MNSNCTVFLLISRHRKISQTQHINHFDPTGSIRNSTSPCRPSWPIQNYMNFWLRGFIGAAIKCYICNSLTDSGCSGQANNKYLKDCSELVDGSKYTLCRKIDQDVPPEDGRKFLPKKRRISTNKDADSVFSNSFWNSGYQNANDSRMRMGGFPNGLLSKSRLWWTAICLLLYYRRMQRIIWHQVHFRHAYIRRHCGFSWTKIHPIKWRNLCILVDFNIQAS